MKWVYRSHAWFSSPYQVLSSIRGWEAWIYSKKQSGLLGRQLTLDQAKALCEQHRAKEGACSKPTPLVTP